MQKNKLKILLLSILCISFTDLVQAQKPHPGKTHKSPEHLSEELDLTDEQVAELKEIKENYRGSMKEARKQMKEDMQAVLTDEQKARLKEIKEKARKGREEQRREMKEYRKANIEPIMLEQRKKLDEYISEEDKTLIDELRTERKALHEEMKAKRKEMKKEGERSRSAISEDKKESMKLQREKVQELVEKYDDKITEILSELDEEKMKWKEDLKEMREKNMEESRMGDRRSKYRALRNRKMSKARFLLMDPNDSGNKDWSLDKNVGSFKVYPVPSSGTNTLEYEVKKAGNIRIVLMDNAGNILREISNEYQGPGVYEKEVDISDLSNQQYYYAILDEQGAVTKKFTVIK